MAESINPSAAIKSDAKKLAFTFFGTEIDSIVSARFSWISLTGHQSGTRFAERLRIRAWDSVPGIG
jgi:hypothetical protein